MEKSELNYLVIYEPKDGGASWTIWEGPDLVEAIAEGEEFVEDAGELISAQPTADAEMQWVVRDDDGVDYTITVVREAF